MIDFEQGNAISKEIVSLQSMQAAQKKFAEGITIYIRIGGDRENKIKSAFQNRFHNVPPSFYSLRIAASGLSFIARSAGKNPATMPTSTANASDITTSQIGM